MALNEEYPIDRFLKDAGIVPSDTTTYATSDIEDALAKAWGAKPEVMCACARGGEKWRKTCDTALIDSVSRAGHPSCEADDTCLSWCTAMRGCCVQLAHSPVLI